MKYRRLGKTEIMVSPVAMGCWSFAGGGPWGHQDDRDSIAAVHAALDVGVNFFDTAEGYGNGKSEAVLGEALVGRRDEAVVATKVSSNHLTGAEVRRACERSLQYLKTDYIDLYMIHWPNRDVPIGETMGALEKLRDQGKIRAIGVSNFGPRDLSELLQAGVCVTNQMSYSLIWRAIEFELKPLCIENGIGILCWGPLCEALLTGKFVSADDVPETRSNTRYFSGDRPQATHGEDGHEQLTFATIDRIRLIAARIGQPMALVALAWLLHQPGVTAVLAGSRKPEHITQNARAAELALSPVTLADLVSATDELKHRLGPNLDMYLTASESRIV